MTKKETIKELRGYVKDSHNKCDKDAIREIIKLVQDSDYKRAFKKLNHLDTFVREGIPEDAWHYIDQARYKTIKAVKMTLRIKPELLNGKKEITIKDGIIANQEAIFSGGATTTEMALSLINADKKLMKEFFEVVIDEPVRRKRKED